MPKPKISRVEVYWHTVTYRTVAMAALIVLLMVLATTYLVFPELTSSWVRRISSKMMSAEKPSSLNSAKQVRFVNLDGRVQVKKANSVQWANADYQMTLDKGDLIQTGSDGVARLSFADGTTYTVKGDTLVTVEENLVARDTASSVGVHISAGALDLQTGKWELPGSKAEVSFENAVASLRENTRAAVRSDPNTKQQEFTVANGGAEVTRGSERVDVSQYQRVTFPTGGPITKTDVLAPPQPVEPANLQPLIVANPKQSPIHFSWKPVPTAVAYQLQVSQTVLFNRILTDKRTTATSLDLPGLDPGEYFWRVRAIDGKNIPSDMSDAYKFTLAAEGKEQEMLLEVDSTELHGNVLEVTGRTEAGAALMINGERVEDIRPDGQFFFFTRSLPKGEQTLVITGQNRRGGTKILRKQILIP